MTAASPLLPPAPDGLGTGVIPPLATPCDENGRVDPAGMARVVEHVVAGGVHGVFVLGTTGEGPALAVDQRVAALRAAVAAAAGRVPVLVGVTDGALDGVTRVADAAAEAGADALVVAPPPYSPAAVPELNHYLDLVAERAPLPLLLYDMPARTFPVPMQTLRHAMTLERFVGFKDSSGRMTAMHEAIHHRDRERPGFRLLVGPEELLAEAVLLGADGGVSGGANLFPKLFVALFDAAARGDLACVRRLHATVISISATLYRAGRHGSSFIKVIKHGLATMGLCEDHLVPPYERFREDDRERVQRLFRDAAAAVENALSA